MDIFISYRRDGGLEIARSVKNELARKKYNSFFDLESIQEGEVPEHIAKNISKSNNFLIFLTSNCLERCKNEGDWVRIELASAISQNKNIIPVACRDFVYPSELPKDIDKIRFIQAIAYNGENYDDMIAKIIDRLKDEKGGALKLAKAKNISNTFYEYMRMDQAEISRIKSDYETCRRVEEDIFSRLLAGKKDITLFNPAIYDADSYMKKYDRPEIKRVFGMLAHKEDVEEAMAKYAVRGHQQNKFCVGNMEHVDFADEMDRILAENSLQAFDFVDLTLILRDLADPIEKLRQVVDRVNTGGIIYVRELDHGMALAYPDERELFKKMFKLIEKDDYAGDFTAGRKVYFWMKNAFLENIRFEARQISNIGLNRRERRTMFDALFSYVEREYRIMCEKDDSLENKKALEWLRENYRALETEFYRDDFFYSSGFMEFYGIVE